MLGKLADDHSVVWSPDERYIALTFRYVGLYMANYTDLIVIDTATGEAFIAEAPPKRLKDGGVLTALNACFDASGENIYYAVYGDVTDGVRSGIKRYSIATGESTLICALPDAELTAAGLFMEGDGSLLCVSTHDRQDCVLTRISNDGSG